MGGRPECYAFCGLLVWSVSRTSTQQEGKTTLKRLAFTLFVMFSLVPGLTLLSPAVQATKIDEPQVEGAQSAVCPIQGSTSLCVQLDQSFTIVDFGDTP